MDLGLTGQVAMVAAASQGIGKACALKLAEAGTNVSICARTESTLRETADEIRERTGVEVFALPVDVTQPEETAHWINETAKTFGKINVLVTNAGGPPATKFIETGDEAWQTGLDLTLKSTIRLIRGVLPYMIQEDGGRIINITSVSVFQPIRRLLMSNVIRPAVHGLTRALAEEYAPNNILINNVCPGYTLTDRVKELIADKMETENISQDEALQAFTQAIPMHRMAEPAEIGKAVLFYASDLASYVTGTSLLVDGGFVNQG